MYQTDQETMPCSFAFLFFLVVKSSVLPFGSYRRCPGIRLPERVEQILRGYPLHRRGSIHPNSLRRLYVALPVTLDLIKDNSSDDDQENTAKSQTE